MNQIIIKKAKDVRKGWGKEVQIANYHAGLNDFPLGYSGKLLVYDKMMAKSSMHYHAVKHETFYVLNGVLQFAYYDLNKGIIISEKLIEGDVVVIPPCSPHQLQCLTANATIIEFASTDDPDDNYRIAPGDSQNSR